MTSALQELDEGAYRFYHDTHPHPPMAEKQYLSASLLTAYTAPEVLSALRLSALGVNGGDDVPPYYRARGDSMAEGAYGVATHQEIRFVVPSPRHPGRVIAGHCDAIHICPERCHVAVGEHKVHKYVTSFHQEKARRQGLFYLAAAWATRGQICEPAQWAPKGSPSFVWPEGALPEGVSVVAASDSQAIDRRQKYEYGVAAVEQALAYYQAKSDAIWDAYDEGPDVPVDWDVDAELIHGPVGDCEILPIADIVDKLAATDRLIDDLRANKQRLEAQARLAARDGEAYKDGINIVVGHSRGRSSVSVTDVRKLAQQQTDPLVRKAILDLIRKGEGNTKVYAWTEPVEAY